MDRAQWVWMPHPAHLCVAQDCRFHLATYVGKYIVSTVGEYLPDADAREVLAQSRGIKLVGRGDARQRSWMEQAGWEEIGYGRTYETMVFKAKPGKGCCPYRIDVTKDMDMQSYNAADDAQRGHLELCAKWSKAACGD